MSVIREKKVVIVGDGGVGKSQFVKRLSGFDFDPIYKTTLGVEVRPIVDRDCGIKYNIWDIAGKEKFDDRRVGYYKNSDIAIIMYSLDNKWTANSVSKWKQDILKNCGNIKIYVIGNKMDCENKVEVESDFKVSCKTGFSINDFMELIRE
jgi:GTP-binding nuclear protein Ran